MDQENPPIFQCLANLVSRNTGDIHIGNWIVSEKNARKIREHIGFLFQNSEDQLFLPTVEEELTFGLFNLGKTNEEILACITETTHIFGIEELLERKIFHLSQGEKRKVAMAAIYAMNPDIYLLDEPFNNLDPKTRSELREVLNHLHENGKTLLLISHELENIPSCFTRVLVLHQGSLIFDGQLRTLYEKTDILTQVNFEIPSISRIYRRLCQNPLIKEQFTNTLPPITEEDFIKLLERIINH